MKTRKIKEGKIQKKHVERTRDRQRQQARNEKSREEAKTRRRTTFDFDLWAEDGGTAEEKKPTLPSDDWLTEETLIQTSLGSSPPLTTRVDQMTNCKYFVCRNQPVLPQVLQDEEHQHWQQTAPSGGS